MATQFHIAGATEIYYGGTTSSDLLGVTEGVLNITIQEDHATIPITTDSEGGRAEDYLQIASRAVVMFTLSKWDQAIADRLSAVLRTLATPALATSGQAQSIALLRFGDKPVGLNHTMRIKPTKLTSGSGMYILDFPKIIEHPEQMRVLEKIGSSASQRRVVALAHASGADGSQVLYTKTAIT